MFSRSLMIFEMLSVLYENYLSKNEIFSDAINVS